MEGTRNFVKVFQFFVKMAFITQSGLITSTNDVFDRITGTSVNDTVVYSLATSSVNVSLSIVGTQNTGGSGFDELISIENITGSNFNDNFQGNSGNNVFNGGVGIDTVSYANATGSVIVSLTEVVGFYWTDTGSVIVNPERDGSVAISL